MVREYHLPVRHDWQNHDSCECGQVGCGSYRPLGPGFPSMREAIAEEKAAGDD